MTFRYISARPRRHNGAHHSTHRPKYKMAGPALLLTYTHAVYWKMWLSYDFREVQTMKVYRDRALAPQRMNNFLPLGAFLIRDASTAACQERRKPRGSRSVLFNLISPQLNGAAIPISDSSRTNFQIITPPPSCDTWMLYTVNHLNSICGRGTFAFWRSVEWWSASPRPFTQSSVRRWQAQFALTS